MYIFNFNFFVLSLSIYILPACDDVERLNCPFGSFSWRLRLDHNLSVGLTERSPSLVDNGSCVHVVVVTHLFPY